MNLFSLYQKHLASHTKRKELELFILCTKLKVQRIPVHMLCFAMQNICSVFTETFSDPPILLRHSDDIHCNVGNRQN